MKNLKFLGKVLDKKEQIGINGGTKATLCLALCNNGLRLCTNGYGSFYVPCIPAC